jgi:hypothetical protein
VATRLRAVERAYRKAIEHYAIPFKPIAACRSPEHVADMESELGVERRVHPYKTIADSFFAGQHVSGCLGWDNRLVVLISASLGERHVWVG